MLLEPGFRACQLEPWPRSQTSLGKFARCLSWQRPSMSTCEEKVCQPFYTWPLHFTVEKEKEEKWNVSSLRSIAQSLSSIIVEVRLNQVQYLKWEKRADWFKPLQLFQCVFWRQPPHTTCLSAHSILIPSHVTTTHRKNI